jgi:hypothetical protein
VRLSNFSHLFYYLILLFLVPQNCEFITEFMVGGNHDTVNLRNVRSLATRPSSFSLCSSLASASLCDKASLAFVVRLSCSSLYRLQLFVRTRTTTTDNSASPTTKRAHDNTTTNNNLTVSVSAQKTTERKRSGR